MAIFWVSKSWEKVVMYGYWPLSIYYVGQLYVFQVIRAEELYHPLYPDGRSLYFKFTPLLVLGVTMIITWIVKMFRGVYRANWLISILLLSVLSRLASNYFGSGWVPNWVEIGKMVNNLSLIVWLWWAASYFKRINIEKKKYFWNYLSNTIKMSIIIASGLVFAQAVRGSVLGLVVEQRTSLPVTDSGVSWLTRTIGIWNHPNDAAIFIFFWLIAWLMIEVRNKKSLKEILNRWLLIPLVALICLQSRSVFLGLIPILFWLKFLYKKETNFEKIWKMKIKGWKLWILMGVMALSVLVLGNRLWSSITNFGEYSGWDTRQKLMTVASQVIKNHFWWGVGDGNYIPVAFREDKSGIMKSFPESVHQGAVLILAEEGIIGILVWLIFIMVLVKYWWDRTKNNLKLRWLFLGSLLSQQIVIFFQPLSNILMANVLVAVLLLANEDEKYF